MDRVPEPELMDDPAQARAYAEADFSEPHQAFVDRFAARFPTYNPRHVLDLGCGSADITIRFARAYRECDVVGVDGSDAMLVLGRAAVRRAKLDQRIQFRQARLPHTHALGADFDTLIGNSLLHHLTDPLALWHAVARHAQAGAAVFVMDLLRPESRAAAEALIDEYALTEPEILRRDFFNSLLAAYRPEEIERQLAHAALPLKVEVVSDRHVVIYGQLS